MAASRFLGNGNEPIFQQRQQAKTSAAAASRITGGHDSQRYKSEELQIK